MIHFKGRHEGSHFQGHKRPRTIAILSNIGFQDLTVTPDAANGKDRDLIRLHYHLISREYRTVCIVMYWLHTLLTSCFMQACKKISEPLAILKSYTTYWPNISANDPGSGSKYLNLNRDHF